MIRSIPGYDLSARNTFGMKVRCALYVEVTAEEDLPALDFDALPQPVFVMGGGSNLLFSGDFPGTILHIAIGVSVPGEGDSVGGTPFASLTPAPPIVHCVPALRGNSRPTGPSPYPCPGVDMSSDTIPLSRNGDALEVTLGAGVVFDDFCAWAAAEGLWGPENLSLIPGEVGASAVQNIGAYGVEAKDIITGIRAWDRQEGRFVDIDPADCAYGYRTSRFKKEWKGRYIITAVTFRLSCVPQPKLDYGGVRKALEARGKLGMPSETCGHPRPHKREGPASRGSGRGRSEAETVLEGIPNFPLTPQDIRETIIDIRRQKLPDPAEIGSAGSFFCNPVVPEEHFQRIVAIAQEANGPDYAVPHYVVEGGIKVPAAWMIEQCGFKGVMLGGAQVYPKQPLVIVNATGAATPAEVIALRDRVIDTVRERYGVTLHPEVELV